MSDSIKPEASWRRPTRSGDYAVMCIFWIVCAGAIYPTLVLLLITLASLRYRTPNLLEAIATFGGGILVGIVIAFACSLLTVSLLWTLNALLARPFSNRVCAVAAGGLALYIPTASPVVVSALEFQDYRSFNFLLSVTLGPLLATMIGSLVVYRFSLRVNEPNEAVPSELRRFRVNIRQLMTITALAAIALAIIKIAGSVALVIVIIGWIILQPLILSIGATINLLTRFIHSSRTQRSQETM